MTSDNSTINNIKFFFSDFCIPCCSTFCGDIKLGVLKIGDLAKNKCKSINFCCKFFSDSQYNLDQMSTPENIVIDRGLQSSDHTIINVLYNGTNNTGNVNTNLDDTCIICSSNISGAVIMPCLHSQFCFECIEKWQIEKGTCPTCREKISDIVQCI